MNRSEWPDRTTLVASAAIFLGFAVSTAVYPLGHHSRNGHDDGHRHRAPVMRTLSPPHAPVDRARRRSPSGITDRDLRPAPRGQVMSRHDRRRRAVRHERPRGVVNDPTLRWSAEQLAYRESSLLPVLRRLLVEDADPRVRAEAAHSLGGLRDTGSVPDLAQALMGDRNALVRAQAASALALAGDERATGALIQAALTDVDAGVRGEAVSSLGKLRLLDGVVPLAIALRDDAAEDVRRRAAISLAQIGDPSVLEALQRSMVRDASATVRREATRAGTTIERRVVAGR